MLAFVTTEAGKASLLYSYVDNLTELAIHNDVRKNIILSYNAYQPFDTTAGMAGFLGLNP
jgi:hypothetical protein